MQFNSEANGLDIISDINFLCGTAAASYSLADKTRNCNFALDKVSSLIMRSDGNWKWQDQNDTKKPIGTDDLVANQKDYGLSLTYLKVLSVRIKDQSGNWRKLTPKKRNNLNDAEINETAGDPRTYSKIGGSLYLFPVSSYNSSGGLEVQVQKSLSYFTITDTTKVPGFDSRFHRLISLYAALDFCAVNVPARVLMITNAITKMEAELVEAMADRSDDEQPNISLKVDDYGEQALI